MDFLKRTLPILIGIFLLSVLVRLPQLNRPLSKHHEFCDAVALRIMQVWYDEGIAKFNYNPVMNYAGEANKHINNFANASGKMVDTAGNYYYVSHPPFAYYFPFFVFKTLGIRPDVLPLQVFNLVLNFISALFIYFIVCLLSFRRPRSLPFRSAIVAFVAYVFSPAVLWFQGNVYMSDMAVHTLFIIGVYTTLKMIIRQKFSSPKYIFFYCLTLALMIYTSWLGAFFAFGVLVYSLLHVRQIQGFRVLIWSTALITVIVLRLIIFQYAQINGAGAYLSELLNRYVERGSIGETNSGLLHFFGSYLWLIKSLLYNYLANYLPIYLLIIAFMWLGVSRSKLKIVFSENGYRFMWLSVLPVVLMHVVFLNYSVQDFTTLYASLFFSVLLGVLFDKLKKARVVELRSLRIIIVVSVLAGVGMYSYINRPGERSWNDALYARSKNAGTAIQREAKPEEVVFLLGEEPDPQMVFYAQRNIQRISQLQDAVAFLEMRKLSNGVVFTPMTEGVAVRQRLDLAKTN